MPKIALARTIALMEITILHLLFCFVAFASEPPHVITVLSTRDLSTELNKVFDVRWADDESVYLGSSKKGVVQVRIEEQSPHKVVMPAGAGRSGWGYSKLGLSRRYLVGGAPAFFIAWQEVPGDQIKVEYFEAIADIDVFEDRLVLIGARKDDNQKFSPDGAIAWTGSFKTELKDLKPVHFSIAGAGARPMDACGPFNLAKVRFLRDGSFVVLPGVEPGLYLYSKTGQLLRTWQTDELGIDTECGLNKKEMYHLSADYDARAAWINQRRTVDEILALPEGPGLILRKSSDMGTTWQLKVLGADGDVGVVDLPFVGASPNWHLTADVRGERIVFLLLEYSIKPVSPARMIITTLPLESRKSP